MNMRDAMEARRTREIREAKRREWLAAMLKVVEVIAATIGFAIAMWCVIQICRVGVAAALLIGGLA